MADYNPVSHDKPAPGGQTDHTSPGLTSDKIKEINRQTADFGIGVASAIRSADKAGK